MRGESLWKSLSHTAPAHAFSTQLSVLRRGAAQRGPAHPSPLLPRLLHVALLLLPPPTGLPVSGPGDALPQERSTPFLWDAAHSTAVLLDLMAIWPCLKCSMGHGGCRVTWRLRDRKREREKESEQEKWGDYPHEQSAPVCLYTYYTAIRSPCVLVQHGKWCLCWSTSVILRTFLVMFDMVVCPRFTKPTIVSFT